MSAGTEHCEGCGRPVNIKQLTTVTMPDEPPTKVACCPHCEPHARTVAETLKNNNGYSRCDGCTQSFPQSKLDSVTLRDGTVLECCPTCLEAAPERADSKELKTPPTTCSQCHEQVHEELYHVTTIDERTEALCSACKREIEQKGVVKSVKLRTDEARAILGVAESATDEEIRDAFLEQIKHAHPDRKSGTQSAFKQVKAAYDRLS